MSTEDKKTSPDTIVRSQWFYITATTFMHICAAGIAIFENVTQAIIYIVLPIAICLPQLNTLGKLNKSQIRYIWIAYLILIPLSITCFIWYRNLP